MKVPTFHEIGEMLRHAARFQFPINATGIYVVSQGWVDNDGEVVVNIGNEPGHAMVYYRFIIAKDRRSGERRRG